MKLETVPAKEGRYNLKDYDEQYKRFDWKDVKKHFTWAITGKVNIAYEAIDRHCEGTRKHKVALLYRDEKRTDQYTFHEMKEWSNRAGNVFKDHGVKKGDLIFIFLPRIPELYFTLLGAVKIGAIPGTLFESFMKDALSQRLQDSGTKYLVTTPQLLKRIPEKVQSKLQTIFLIGENIVETEKYINFMYRLNKANKSLAITWVSREDGFLLQYTSGSTGLPKGVLHVHDAMQHHFITAKWVLDLQEQDVYWCTEDPGWITGTVYGMFAPWLTGTTICVYGGRFRPEEWYRTIEMFGVTVLYTAPTALRMLMGAGDEILKEYDLSSLRHILTVGEQLSPDIINWGLNALRLRIHDTWWMAETGGIIISNFPSLEIRPGSMGKPIPGIKIAIVDHEGNELPPNQIGNLAIQPPWPAMIRQIWGDRNGYSAYFHSKGYFLTGDAAYKDEDGYIWYQGRLNDEIITSGERLGSFEIERKLMEHPAVKEAGVIRKPDPARGEIVKAFLVLKEGCNETPALLLELNRFVQEELSKKISIEEIELVDELPKTRSGKLIRRALRKL